jgi:putative membrane protein
MTIIGNVLVGLVALIHAYILVLEMFLWTGRLGRRAFNMTPEFAKQTRVLGLNQGLYNGFLAAGLVWGLAAGGNTGFAAKVFFLVCVGVAGIVGAATASRRILFVQTVPALAALVFVIAAH